MDAASTTSSGGAQAAATPTTSGSDGSKIKVCQSPSMPLASTLLVASIVVVLSSTLAYHLMGKSIAVHFLVLVLYGAVFCKLGAVFFGQQPQRHGVNSKSDTTAVGGTDGRVASNGSTAAAGNSRGFFRENSHGQPSSHPPNGNTTATASASPLNWVGETVEGSMNWLRGAGGSSGGGGGGDYRLVDGGRSRDRSRSDGGAGIGSRSPRADLTNGGGSAATSPGGGVRGRGGIVSPAGPAPGFLGFGRAAATTAEAALGHTQRQIGRARGWSRTFGGGGVGMGVGSGVGDGSVMGGDDDSSGDDMDAEDEAAAEGADWMVGVGIGDESESGSLSSVTTGGWRGDPPGARRRYVSGGESGTDLNWEVDGRRQMLRRSSTSAGIRTEDNQMVQDLLEMISDAPVNHAGQWRPVRVRRGIHIWTSTVAGSPYCRIRGRMRCEATPAQLLQLLIDDERIAEYDWMFDRYELVERPNDHTSVRWTSYRAIWPTRPRDFVIRSTWEEFADGTIVIATRSVEHDDYQETPTFVRGKMVMCGYVICPLGESRRRRRSRTTAAANGTAGVSGNGSGVPGAVRGTADGTGNGSTAASAAAAAAGVRSPEGRPSSEFTMYAHTDLGGNLPASVINKLCKKPAYRVLRKIQDMIEADTLVKRGDGGEGPVATAAGKVGGAAGAANGGGPRPISGRMLRNDSEDVLGSLLEEGMPDRDAAANLEDVPEGELEGAASGAETDPSGAARRRGSATSGGSGDTGSAATAGSMGRRRASATQQGPTTPSPLLPGLSREFAISEAQRIMKTLNRMASDEGLGWAQLGVSAHRDMALYKSPVVGTKKVRLGASTCVSALPSELVGILLENAAMLGPDYIVDRQELLETFSSGVRTGEGGAEALARAEGREPQHDTAIYWFSCTHKRQRICRDFVILRCFRPLPGQGAVIAYSSIDHPGLPPCPDYVRGKLDVSGFVIVPSAQEEEDAQERKAHLSDVEHNRRNGPRHQHKRNKRRSRRHVRRRSRSSASGVNSYMDSDDDNDDEEEEVVNRRGGGNGLGGGRGEGGGSSGRGSGISEVTFFTHLTFSAFLPDFQEMEACRHFVGPLHILQELKWVVERTLGSSQEDEVVAEAAAKLNAGAMGGGADWGRPVSSHTRRKSATDGSGRRVEGGDADAGAADEDTSACDELGTGSASVSESESTPARGGAPVSNAVLLRVSARREAVLRDMLAFSSDGECMDGPQVDWRLIKHGEGVRLWRAQIPGTVWCMIRTRTAVPASPQTVLDYLLDDSCIPQYDELFDKIDVIEPVDDVSTFKRTCYKPIWPTAPRDFSLLCSWGMLEDGTAYLLNRSVDHPSNPPVKGYVRGVVMLCGFLMVPRSPEAGGGCTITMIVHTDLGGNLPAGILNRLSTSSPWRLVQRLRAVFEKGVSAAAVTACTVPCGSATAGVTAGAGTGTGGAQAASRVPPSVRRSVSVSAPGSGRQGPSEERTDQEQSGQARYAHSEGDGAAETEVSVHGPGDGDVAESAEAGGEGREGLVQTRL